MWRCLEGSRMTSRILVQTTAVEWRRRNGFGVGNLEFF